MRNTPTASALCILALCMPRSMRGCDFPNSLEPLNLREYNKFAIELKKANLRPEQLLQYLASPIGDGQIMNCADCSGLAYARIAKLIETIPNCKRIMEGWDASHNLWVIGRGDSEYPRRLKNKMKWNAPAFLFGIGDKSILNVNDFIAVVGSRNIPSERFSEAKYIGEKIVQDNFCLVSGAARGSDKASMIGALKAIGRQKLVSHRKQSFATGVLGILPHELAKRSKYEDWMNEGIRSGNLTLVTTEAPDAPFTPHAAYARNDLIHAMGQATIVIECEVEKGGTWGGVTLAAKRGIMEHLFVLDGDANKSILETCSKFVEENKLIGASVLDTAKSIKEQISKPLEQHRYDTIVETENVKTTNTIQDKSLFVDKVLPIGNYVVYTDGGCRPNPGVGGWSAVILQRGKNTPVLELHGGELETTNNRMELTAALQALKYVKGSHVELYTDSQYLKKAFTEGWLKRWVQEDWVTASGIPVKNRDLWQCLLNAVEDVNVKWRWVRGHTGNIWNEWCNRLSGQEIEQIVAKKTLEEDNMQSTIASNDGR